MNSTAVLSASTAVEHFCTSATSDNVSSKAMFEIVLRTCEIEAGFMLSSVAPRPISIGTKNGEPAISPQTIHEIPRALVASTTALIARNTAGLRVLYHL